MRASRTTSLTALLAAGALALTACGGADESDPDEGTATEASPSAASPSQSEGESAGDESDGTEPTGDESASATEASESADDASESASPSTSETGSADASSTDASSTEAGPSLSEDPPRWSFPLNVEGWETSVIDKNGINQLQNSQGCRFTSSQNRVQPDPDQSAREASQDLAEEFEQGLSRQAAETDFTYGEAEIHLFMDAGTTDAVSLSGTYANSQGQEFETTFLARVIPEQQSWVSLQYACPADAYDEDEMAELFRSTQLDSTDPAPFED